MANHIIVPCDSGDISDGFHTFSELYQHRQLLFIALMLSHPEISWRSLRHDDGNTAFEDYFVAGMQLPSAYHESGIEGITYHLEMKYWILLEGITTHKNAPKWDGHTSDDVLERLKLWIEDSLCAESDRPITEINVDSNIDPTLAAESIKEAVIQELAKQKKQSGLLQRDRIQKEIDAMNRYHNSEEYKRDQEKTAIENAAEHERIFDEIYAQQQEARAKEIDAKVDNIAQSKLNLILMQIKANPELYRLMKEKGLVTGELNDELYKAEDREEDYKYD